MEEYKFLREEMMKYSSEDNTNYTFTITSVTAILAFAIERQNRYVIIGALILLLAMLSKVIEARKKITKIAAYIHVFLEPKLSIKWETRNLQYESLKSNSASKIMKFFMPIKYLIWDAEAIASGICYVSYMTKALKWCKTTEQYIHEYGLLFIVLCLIITIIICSARLKRFHKNKDEQIDLYKSILMNSTLPSDENKGIKE